MLKLKTFLKGLKNEKFRRNKMKVLSNVEFEKLTKEQSPRLRALSKARCDRNPTGFLMLADLDTVIQVCKYSGDQKATQWLKSLKLLAENGELEKVRTQPDSWTAHVYHVAALYKKGEIAFDLFDHIMLKETGKRGTVVDYNPDSKEFLVVLDPFQLQSFPKGDLEKVASKVVKE